MLIWFAESFVLTFCPLLRPEPRVVQKDQLIAIHISRLAWTEIRAGTRFGCRYCFVCLFFRYSLMHHQYVPQHQADWGGA